MSADVTFSSEEFRTLLLVRLHLPLHLDDRRCRCGELLDAFGHHRSACSRIGILGQRGLPAEICAARICREGGARVRENQFVRDLNVEIPTGDFRKIEVIANGLPFWEGKQVAIDTTVVSALTGRGLSRGRKAGQALRQTKKYKENKYHEIVKNERCRLVVMTFEVA